MKELMAELFNYPRSLTGEGVRQTLRRIQREIPIEIREVPSGTKCFDWKVPQEWRFHSARLFDETGALLIDADNCGLHVLGYSEPFHDWVTFDELDQHVVVGPKECPDAIEYTTSYFERRWGLSVSWNQWQAVKRREGQRFLVQIKSELFHGSLTYADLVVPGESGAEIFLTSYVCHAAGLANNECSGPTVLTALVKWWQEKPRRHTLRVLLAPETIGAIAYLSRDVGILRHPETGDTVSMPFYAAARPRLRAGYTLTCIGGPGSFCLQLGRRENYASRIARHVLGHEYNAEIRPWSQRGSDERQFTAPGIDLPMATVMKTPPGSPLYPCYHRSDDNLDYVSEEQLQESLDLMKRLLTCIEEDLRYRTLVLGEPMLSKRNLMPTLSRVGSSDGVRKLMTSWSYCDGRTLLENAEEQGRPMWQVLEEVRILEREKLVEVVDGEGGVSPKELHRKSWENLYG